jgi:hypothetical protein
MSFLREALIRMSLTIDRRETKMRARPIPDEHPQVKTPKANQIALFWLRNG